MSFIIGQTYLGKDGNKYTCLEINENKGIFRLNNITKTFHIIKYAGIDAVCSYGEILLKSDKIKPISYEIGKKLNEIRLNKLERYIDVFKKHKII